MSMYIYLKSTYFLLSTSHLFQILNLLLCIHLLIQESCCLPGDRRDLGRELRVHHGLGHDLGRLQLEAQLQVSQEVTVFNSGRYSNFRSVFCASNSGQLRLFIYPIYICTYAFTNNIIYIYNICQMVPSAATGDGPPQRRPVGAAAHAGHGRRPLLHRPGLLLRGRLLRRRDGHLGRREP